MFTKVTILLLFLASVAPMSRIFHEDYGHKKKKDMKVREKFNKIKLELRLSSQEYIATQNFGTEVWGSGKYWKHFESGKYNCVVCNKLLFSSEHKYEFASGWPTFGKAVGEIHEMEDRFKHRIDMHADRVWCRCTNCGSSLGYKFLDGPEEYNGVRYCINSSSLNFKSDANDFNRIQ